MSATVAIDQYLTEYRRQQAEAEEQRQAQERTAEIERDAARQTKLDDYREAVQPLLDGELPQRLQAELGLGYEWGWRGPEVYLTDPATEMTVTVTLKEYADYVNWRVVGVGAGPDREVKSGHLLSAVMAMIAFHREQRAANEEAERAKQAERARGRAEYVMALETHERLKPRVDAAKEAAAYVFPRPITVYYATWTDGWVVEESVTSPTYKTGWALSDQPDDDGYYLLEGGARHIRPPASTLTWQRHTFEHIEQLPFELVEMVSVPVPGLAHQWRQVVDEDGYPLDSAQWLYAEQEDGRISVDVRRPAPWLRLALES